MRGHVKVSSYESGFHVALFQAMTRLGIGDKMLLVREIFDMPKLELGTNFNAILHHQAMALNMVS
jgi:hypothetical protein